MRINYSLEESLILGKIEGRGIRGRQRMMDWIEARSPALQADSLPAELSGSPKS